MINYPSNIRVYDNYLPEFEADAVYNGIKELNPSWFTLRRKAFDRTSTGGVGTDYIYTKTWWDAFGGSEIIHAPLDERDRTMTYQFLGTDNHHAGCDCSMCDLHTMILQHPAPEVTNQYIAEAMLTVYRPRDYLSMHHDERENRTWAFTYSLNKDWRPEWGGILNCQDESGDWYALSPKYNRLILMDVTPTNSVNHFVSQVIPEAPEYRVTFSGWYGHYDNMAQAA